jgi:hypothetical protein
MAEIDDVLKAVDLLLSERRELLNKVRKIEKQLQAISAKCHIDIELEQED